MQAIPCSLRVPTYGSRASTLLPPIRPPTFRVAACPPPANLRRIRAATAQPAGFTTETMAALDPRRGHAALRRGRFSAADASYFLTLYTENKRSGLTCDSIAAEIHREFAAMEADATWIDRCHVVMPDHLHALIVLVLDFHSPEPSSVSKPRPRARSFPPVSSGSAASSITSSVRTNPPMQSSATFTSTPIGPSCSGDRSGGLTGIAPQRTGSGSPVSSNTSCRFPDGSPAEPGSPASRLLPSIRRSAV